MTILFLDAYFEPEQTSFTHLERDLLKSLISAGHSVKVICPVPTRGIDKKTADEYKRMMDELKNGYEEDLSEDEEDLTEEYYDYDLFFDEEEDDDPYADEYAEESEDDEYC